MQYGIGHNMLSVYQEVIKMKFWKWDRLHMVPIGTLLGGICGFSVSGPIGFLIGGIVAFHLTYSIGKINEGCE